MMKICENPVCGREFNALVSQQRFCTKKCCNSHNNRRYYQEKKTTEETAIEVAELLRWKEDHIRTYHEVYSVEQIANLIKKSVDVVIAYCKANNLTYRHKNEMYVREKKQTPSFKRVPAVYDNQKSTYGIRDFKKLIS
jgi:transposase-like protein